MFNLNYEEIYEEIDEKLKDPVIPVVLKQHILNFEIAIRNIELLERREKAEDLKHELEDMEDEIDESGSVGC